MGDVPQQLPLHLKQVLDSGGHGVKIVGKVGNLVLPTDFSNPYVKVAIG